jgi:peptidoglycan/LPS O-acetylase OafA/YrhL
MMTRLFDKWSILAGLRFVLAATVMLTHLAAYSSAPWARFLGLGAFEAIEGFLIISGYSIGASYSAKPAGFYARRAERIYPAYIGAILINFWAVGAPTITVLIANILFLNQLITTDSYIGPAWSLSLEVWLYVLTPFFARLPTRKLYIIICISLASYLCYTPLRTLLHVPYFSGVSYGANLLFLSFLWILGFALATRASKWRTLIFIGLALAAQLTQAFAIRGLYQFKHSALRSFLAYDIPNFIWRGAILAAVVSSFYLILSGKLPDRKSRILNWLGDISYPLYLVHIPILIIATRYGIQDSFVLIGIALTAAALVALIMEFPVRHIRRANYPSAIPQTK